MSNGMSINRIWIFCFLLLFFASPVLAEGGTCPPGYYPVNSPGVMGCAPMPGGSAEPVDTGPSWMTTWGAIAADGDKQVVASSFNKGSKRKAESAAIKECRAKGGSKKCKTWVSFYNQCGALAAGDSQAVAFRAGTIEEASRGAVKDCSALTPNCRIVQTVCSYPVRVN
jgi:hypothetical protein